MNLVELKNVNKIYGRGHTALKALSNVNLGICEGDILLIIGPSGSGKSTLLSVIATLLRPTSGSVSFEGQSVSSLKGRKLADLRLKKIGFMFQAFNLFSALTAQQNVMAPMLISGQKREKAARKAADLLKQLNLEHRLDNLPKDLSGGEKQRVAMARALANEPKLILADEPTANLDSKTGHEAVRLLCSLACEQNRAVVIVSHDQRIRDFAKRIIIIEDGRLVNEETGGHNLNCKIDHSKLKT